MPGLDGYELVAVYQYVDGQGRLLYERGRFHANRPDRRHRTWRERRDPAEDWGSTQEFVAGDVTRVPYRLPDLLAGVASGRAVFVCEGEKDVDCLRAHGLVATTTFAQPRTWSDNEAVFFEGAQVVILPDNDEQGRMYASLLQRVLKPVARSIAVVELPGLGPGEDVSDWLAQGYTVQRLGLLVGGTKAVPEG